MNHETKQALELIKKFPVKATQLIEDYEPVGWLMLSDLIAAHLVCIRMDGRLYPL